MAVIRGESCFEEDAFEDTEKHTRPPQLEFLEKEYLEKYSRYRKNVFFVCFKALLTAYFILWENQF